ncbi:2TM domain-containing protein [candidate division KSB1 bacterium]|nr:2TM domain-containing protein [candidate division KSB1 bacterium]
MFKLSRNLKIFSVLFILYTIGFRYFLSLSITNHNHVMLWATAIIYGVTIFITAFVLGKSEDINIGVIYLGFKYHLMTYVIFNVIALLLHSLGFVSQYEDFSHFLLLLVAWGIGLLIHFLFSQLSSKNAIKGVPKEDIFE